MIKLMLFILSVLLLAVFVPHEVSALTPSAETQSCLNNTNDLSSEDNDCREIRCEWRNRVNNWPQPTGYSEDCSEDHILVNPVFIGGLLVASGLSIWVAVHHRHLQHATNPHN